MSESELTTTCCITGGGPAGLMTGYLLARQGIDVIVLEKHADFFRDFRGDTVHPSTLRAMQELGLLDKFLQKPHQKIKKVSVKVQNKMITMVDLMGRFTKPPYMIMMPQWDFLNFILDQANEFPNFRIIMQAEVLDVLILKNKVTGVVAKINNENIQINSELVIGADGRHSRVREVIHEKMGLNLINYGVAIDVLWFRLSRNIMDSDETFGALSQGQMMVIINRGTYWQCAFVIPKDQFEDIKNLGLTSFKKQIIKDNKFLEDRLGELDSWDKVKLLSVQINRLEKWYCDGLLCIGDSAHAMSPVGGVGINLAIQDAIAVNNILAEKLIYKTVSIDDLKLVQKRREWPTKWTQKMQIQMHKNLIYKIIDKNKLFEVPLILKIIEKLPFLSKIMGYIIGMGFRTERVRIRASEGS